MAYIYASTVISCLLHCKQSNSNFDTDFICKEIRWLIVTVYKGLWSLLVILICTTLHLWQLACATYSFFIVVVLRRVKLWPRLQFGECWVCACASDTDRYSASLKEGSAFDASVKSEGPQAYEATPLFAQWLLRSPLRSVTGTEILALSASLPSKSQWNG